MLLCRRTRLRDWLGPVPNLSSLLLVESSLSSLNIVMVAYQASF